MRQLRGVVLLVAMMISVGCDKPVADSTKKHVGATGKTVAPESIVVMTIAELKKKLDLLGHFKADELTADLESKVIKIEGQVWSLEPKFQDDMPQMTVGIIEDFESVTVYVQHPGDDFTARYAMKQQVTLHGKVGIYKDILLGSQKDFLWSIVEAGPNPALIVNAADLAKEYKTNPEAVGTKYENQAFYVLGEIVQPDEIENSIRSPWFTHVVLTGADGIDLKMQMDTSSIQKLGWKAGSKVWILGSPSTTLLEEDGRSLIQFPLCAPVVVKFPLPGVTYGSSAK